MSIRRSGLWCDLCNVPILSDPYWNCSINGKMGHSCDSCRTKMIAQKHERFKSHDVHVIPEFEGEPVHEESDSCWCKPECIEVNEDTGVKAWSHRRPE